MDTGVLTGDGRVGDVVGFFGELAPAYREGRDDDPAPAALGRPAPAGVA